MKNQNWTANYFHSLKMFASSEICYSIKNGQRFVPRRAHIDPYIVPSIDLYIDPHVGSVVHSCLAKRGKFLPIPLADMGVIFHKSFHDLPRDGYGYLRTRYRTWLPLCVVGQHLFER